MTDYIKVQIGQRGGRSRSLAKAEAAKRNGRLGGRPKNKPKH